MGAQSLVSLSGRVAMWTTLTGCRRRPVRTPNLGQGTDSYLIDLGPRFDCRRFSMR